MTDRKILIAGNWKMNNNHLEAVALVQKLAFALAEKTTDLVDVAVIPPFTDLRSVQTLIEADKLPIQLGAQDVSQHASGAYTGEVSASMLAKLHCTYAIVGHSERRDYHGETSEVVAAKAAAALGESVTPIVCVGEKLEVREAGDHISFVTTQLRESLTGLSADQVERCVIAYEPVWAIGTGKVASAADAQEVCAAVRATLANDFGEQVAASVQVLYGGSMNEKNATELVAQTDIDGGLIGGASLDGEKFAGIGKDLYIQASAN